MYTSLKLPFAFDTAGLRRDLGQTAPTDWAPHYNGRDFVGSWAGMSLRSPTGQANDLGVAGTLFTDTPLLPVCEEFLRVLAAFHCPLKAVRLLSLAPGSFIREHCDHALDFEDGEVRIHVPVETNPEVEFYLCGERLLLEAGQSYYLNVNLPHRVNNRGTTDRVHLVIDAEVNDWLRDLFANSSPVPRLAAEDLGIDRFRKIAATRECLAGFTDRRDLFSAAVLDATALGFAFHEGDLDASAALPSTEAPDDLTDWIPVDIEFSDDRPPRAEWIHAPGSRFTEPFFSDSIRRFRRDPLTVLTRSRAPLPLGDGSPAGMIFHVSRCGSTLIARAFAALPTTTVLSEAPPFDQILLCGATDNDKIIWLRSLAKVFASGPLIVKFDAWHMEYLPLIREAFPDTPWIFVSRDPLEVLASHLRQPGSQMIAPSGNTLSRMEFAAGVLAGILRAALDARDTPNGMFVDYAELPEAITGRISEHFGIVLNEAERADIKNACEWDAKNPHSAFQPDSDAKRLTALSFAEVPAVVCLAGLYRQLKVR